MLWEASVLDPNEVSRAFQSIQTLVFTPYDPRVFVSMDSPFPTAKKFSHRHAEAKR